MLFPAVLDVMFKTGNLPQEKNSSKKAEWEETGKRRKQRCCLDFTAIKPLINK